MSTPPIILIVDDDSSHRAMLRTVLRGWGYATDEADDGDTAVEKVTGAPSDKSVSRKFTQNVLGVRLDSKK